MIKFRHHIKFIPRGCSMRIRIAAVGMMMALTVGCAGTVPPKTKPADHGTTGKTAALQAAAGLIQSNAPAEELKIYLSGLHLMKENPHHQMDAHHFCRQVNEELAQCAIFDGNNREANLVGVEYIISERLFETL